MKVHKEFLSAIGVVLRNQFPVAQFPIHDSCSPNTTHVLGDRSDIWKPSTMTHQKGGKERNPAKLEVYGTGFTASNPTNWMIDYIDQKKHNSTSIEHVLQSTQ